nr:MAG TPA: Helix-turn-helix XRE-family like protein [Caudoviricetes sp.]
MQMSIDDIDSFQRNGVKCMKINNERFEVALASSCMTLKELSEKSGIRQETIARIKKSLQNPNPSTVGKIAKALGISVEKLIETEAATSNQLSKGSESN